jgi:hypothetical protein
MSLRVLVLSCALVASGCSQSRVPYQPTAEEHDNALALLMGTEQFAQGGWSPFPQEFAFCTVLYSPHAAASFADLVERGSLPGKLYGLSGLYLADREAFERAVVPFTTSTDAVMTLTGDVGGDQAVADLVLSRAPNAIRIREPVDLRTVWKQMTGMCDIAGGCYPYSFASFCGD